MSFLIAICGGSGSGKSSLSSYLLEAFGQNASILSFDNYYKDLSHLSLDERRKINYDDPISLDQDLFKTHLACLRKGESIVSPLYDFSIHNRKKETLLFEPKEIVIVEGLMTMLIPSEYYDYTVFVKADADLRLARRIDRDTRERGRSVESVLEQYLRFVKPMHDRYIEPCKTYADFVFHNNGDQGIEAEEAQLEVLKAIILRKLHSSR